MQEHRQPSGIYRFAAGADVDIRCGQPGRRPVANISQNQETDKEDTMSIGSEFKEFAMKGNVVDMAVGVIIGAAFGKIVSALVENVIMPPLGMALSGVNFADLGTVIGHAPDGKDVVLKYGAFIQTIFDFLIIAFVLFMALRGINKLKKPAVPAPNAPPPPPPREQVLLEEIRDLLKK
jgi:large conductance mechanosensitive channel